MLKFLLLIPLLAVANGFIVCPQNACALVDCAPMNCAANLMQAKGGWCGCCPVCLTEIAEGHSCMSTFLLGVPSTSKCELGTYCDPGTSKCVRPVVTARAAGMETCAEKKARVTARLLAAQKMGNPLLGLEVPHCDSNGDYAPIQYAGSMAFCVFKNGTSIPGFGVHRWETTGMDCQCALDMYAYQETGLIGKMFHCDMKGNYANVQCTGSVCYCVDDTGNKQLGATSVNIGEMDKLNCGLQVVSRNTRGMETCADKKARIDARLLGAQQSGAPLLGLESPHCDGNGDYAPVQFQGSMAFCVFKNGTAIPGYSVPRWQSAGMDCQCAKDLYAYMATGLIGKLFHCDAKGNYANMQCMGSVCYCVDKTGNQVGSSSVNIGEIGKLNC